MAMARRANRNARIAIKEYITVHILDPYSAGSFGHQLKCRARIRRRDELPVFSDDFLSKRAGQGSFYLWPLSSKTGGHWSHSFRKIDLRLELGERQYLE